MLPAYLASMMILLATFELTGVNLALPSIAHSFHLSVIGLSWVNNSYMLVWSVCLLPAGLLGDYLGKKPIYIFGVLIFGVGSLIVGLSHHFEWLLLGRALQGVGGGATLALGTAIAYSMVPPEQKAKAIGISLGAAAFGLAVGPALGAGLMALGGWRWVFYFNCPIAFIVSAILWVGLPSAKVKLEQWRFDYKGMVLLFLALGGFIVWLTQGKYWGWWSIMGCSLLLLVCIASVALIWVERRQVNPLIHYRLFQYGAFRFGVIFRFGLNVIMLSIMIAIMLFWQNIVGVKPEVAGIMFVPAMVLMGLGSLTASRVLKHMSPYRLAFFGLLLQVLCVIWLMLTPISAPLWLHSASACLYGLGAGYGMSAASVAAFSKVPAKEAGRATGLYFAATIIANLFASAFGAVILSLVATYKLHQLMPAMNQSLRSTATGVFSGATHINHLPVSVQTAVTASFVQGYHGLLVFAVVVMLICGGVAKGLLKGHA